MLSEYDDAPSVPGEPSPIVTQSVLFALPEVRQALVADVARVFGVPILIVGTLSFSSDTLILSLLDGSRFSSGSTMVM